MKGKGIRGEWNLFCVFLGFVVLGGWRIGSSRFREIIEFVFGLFFLYFVCYYFLVSSFFF